VYIDVSIAKNEVSESVIRCFGEIKSKAEILKYSTGGGGGGAGGGF
jgi:hypothetical protein